jgi:hypothetical protein
MRTIAPAIMFLVACQSGEPDTDCSDGKCDQPGGSVEEQCKNSRVNAMDERRPHFIPTGVRWSCKDVNGVTADSNTSDDRGQEYCEYFSLLHKTGIPEIVLDSAGQPAFCDAGTPCATGTCDESIASCVTGTSVDTSQAATVLGKNINERSNTVTGLDPQLSAGQLEWLAQNPSQKVGECVFTSWHDDISMAVTSSETLGGYPLTATTPGGDDFLFKMRVSINSNGAAQQLVQDCLTAGDPKIEDGYTRACTFCGGTNCLPFRKSDPSVCTMAMRIAECGCTVSVADGVGGQRTLDLAQANDLALAKEMFVPTGRRGFTLGTWDNLGGLPTGCRYVRTGAPTTFSVGGIQVDDPNADQTIVACDLNASHITSSTAKDPKEACRQTYGDEVVVHVRAPGPALAKLSCDTTKPMCAGAPWDFANL